MTSNDPPRVRPPIARRSCAWYTSGRYQVHAYPRAIIPSEKGEGGALDSGMVPDHPRTIVGAFSDEAVAMFPKSAGGRLTSTEIYSSGIKSLAGDRTEDARYGYTILLCNCVPVRQ